jgi:hypothetical protein
VKVVRCQWVYGTGVWCGGELLNKPVLFGQDEQDVSPNYPHPVHPVILSKLARRVEDYLERRQQFMIVAGEKSILD